MKNGVVVEVVPGPDPLPFIAEYCPFVWLHTNCNSDGNAASPDDRSWSWLYKSDRHGSERFEVLVLTRTVSDGVSCRLRDGHRRSASRTRRGAMAIAA